MKSLHHMGVTFIKLRLIQYGLIGSAVVAAILAIAMVR